MTKRRQSLKIRIPPYLHSPKAWRRAIHTKLNSIAREQNVEYSKNDQLELEVILYLPENKIGWHDVDNRLKDIMDSLQGRAGGPKSKRRLRAIVPNDHQIHKVTIEKRIPPPQSHGMGHLILRKNKRITKRTADHKLGY